SPEASRVMTCPLARKATQVRSLAESCVSRPRPLECLCPGIHQPGSGIDGDFVGLVPGWNERKNRAGGQIHNSHVLRTFYCDPGFAGAGINRDFCHAGPGQNTYQIQVRVQATNRTGSISQNHVTVGRVDGQSFVSTTTVAAAA
ncbi:MAG: hypothetical protein ACI9WU_003259, partial [Myxococcota bacterium]